MGMKKEKENMVLSIIFIGLAIFMYIVAIPLGVPLRASWGGDVGVDSRTFPKFTAVAMGIVAASFLVYSLVQYAKARKKLRKEGASELGTPKKTGTSGYLMGFAVFGLFVLYGIILVTLGYLVASILVPPIILFVIGDRKKLHYVYVYVFAALLFAIFEWLLKVRLP